uniref:(California timema) hypothetical protein n=1 Tax=Timema californicum TaxID=61474 RepID=A0A7R9PCA2_TIMCA|nr:unnamed protein product [Timema californicum]
MKIVLAHRFCLHLAGLRGSTLRTHHGLTCFQLSGGTVARRPPKEKQETIDMRRSMRTDKSVVVSTSADSDLKSGVLKVLFLTITGTSRFGSQSGVLTVLFLTIAGTSSFGSQVGQTSSTPMTKVYGRWRK